MSFAFSKTGVRFPVGWKYLAVGGFVFRSDRSARPCSGLMHDKPKIEKIDNNSVGRKVVCVFQDGSNVSRSVGNISRSAVSFSGRIGRSAHVWANA